jgi:hypothetical protein
MPSYVDEAIEGCLVYDALHLEDDDVASRAFIKLVVSGPMVDLGRTEDELPLTAMSWCTAKTFEKNLRQIPGIKIGFVKQGVIVWE